jgi:hypothetical protein
MMKTLIKMLLGTSLFLLEQSDCATKVRNRAARKIDDFRGVVQQKYEHAVGRVAKASRVIRGEESQVLGNALLFALGVGTGISVGLLFAPASGQKTRSAIAGSAQQFRTKTRKGSISERARTAANAG